MYGQSARATVYKRKGRHSNETEKRRAKREREQLIRLGICLALFLTVFIGKGVFPQRVQQVSSQFLGLIGHNTDFRGAFARLGESLAQQDSVVGEIGAFCIEVFGEQDDQEQVVEAAAQVELDTVRERQFLNSGADQLAVAAHYLRLDSVPEEWFSPAAVEEVAAPELGTNEQEAIPAVGAVTLQADYQGPELPDGYTMDRLSLGALQTATPVMGTLWSEYGYRDHPIDGEYKFHNGVDLGADSGTDILAFAAGTVEYIGCSDIYGNYLQLDHGQGVKTFYAHCSTLCVGQGETVQMGERIAQVGATGTATGPHLHFEVKCGGISVDPAYYIQYRTP